jgi:hypothetical protein
LGSPAKPYHLFEDDTREDPKKMKKSVYETLKKKDVWDKPEFE